MKIAIYVALSLLPLTSVYGQGRVGNGEDAWVKITDGKKEIELFEEFEARIQGVKFIFPEGDMSPEARALKVLERIQHLDRNLYLALTQVINAWFDPATKTKMFKPNMEEAANADIPDSGHQHEKVGAYKIQLLSQRMGIYSDKYPTIHYEPEWLELSPTIQTVAILHEAYWWYFSQFGHEDSIKSREFNNFVLSYEKIPGCEYARVAKYMGRPDLRIDNRFYLNLISGGKYTCQNGEIHQLADPQQIDWNGISLDLSHVQLDASFRVTSADVHMQMRTGQSSTEDPKKLYPRHARGQPEHKVYMRNLSPRTDYVENADGTAFFKRVGVFSSAEGNANVGSLDLHVSGDGKIITVENELLNWDFGNQDKKKIRTEVKPLLSCARDALRSKKINGDLELEIGKLLLEGDRSLRAATTESEIPRLTERCRTLISGYTKNSSWKTYLRKRHKGEIVVSLPKGEAGTDKINAYLWNTLFPKPITCSYSKVSVRAAAIAGPMLRAGVQSCIFADGIRRKYLTRGLGGAMGFGFGIEVQKLENGKVVPQFAWDDYSGDRYWATPTTRRFMNGDTTGKGVFLFSSKEQSSMFYDKEFKAYGPQLFVGLDVTLDEAIQIKMFPTDDEVLVDRFVDGVIVVQPGLENAP